MRRFGYVRPSTLFNRAKKRFGTTDDVREAAWILPDGSMLDFSGKRQGGSPGVRHMDHREVGHVFPSKEYDKYDNPSAVMMAFCWAGAIRVSNFSSGWPKMTGLSSIDVCRPLTAAQRQTLGRILRQVDEAVVDVDCPGEHQTRANAEWGPGARRFHPDAVVNWVQREVQKCPLKKRKR
jgi:hypothetical protein